MRHLLSIEDLDRADIERILRPRRRASPRSAGATSRRSRPCAAAPSSASSTSRAPAPAPRSSSPPSASPPTSSRSRPRGSSVDKGESLKDTIATLSRLRPGGDRHPLARTPAPPQLVAGWTDAAVVNAGDGKHEHPSQALLDVYTLRRRLGSLDGKRIWIVGDVLHSRVARSNMLAFRTMGAEVTVCGPPTLIPRGIEALGCEVALRRSTSSARPTSSTRCGCSTSG